VLLETDRLKIAEALPMAERLVRELLAFRVRITSSGSDAYGAWRERSHDDLVLAVGIAVWISEHESLGGEFRFISAGPAHGGFRRSLARILSSILETYCEAARCHTEWKTSGYGKEWDLPKPRSDNIRTDLEPDGLLSHPIKPHTREKLYTLGYYLAIFTKAMAKKFKHLAYVDLFAGPGRNTFPDDKQIEGSPLIAARTEPKFTKLIFVEEDSESVAALQERVKRDFSDREIVIIPGNCNEVIREVRKEIPGLRGSGEGVLTVCFVDPFDLSIDFTTLRTLSDFYIDFIVLIADQMAGRGATSLAKPGNTVVERFLDDSEWRMKWKKAAAKKVNFRDFLVERFTAGMAALGFEAGTPMRVKVQGMGVRLYKLAFFSKNDRAIEFWEKTVKKAPTQESLF
jgi:three-Cys-motif partner protein